MKTPKDDFHSRREFLIKSSAFVTTTAVLGNMGYSILKPKNACASSLFTVPLLIFNSFGYFISLINSIFTSNYKQGQIIKSSKINKISNITSDIVSGFQLLSQISNSFASPVIAAKNKKWNSKSGHTMKVLQITNYSKQVSLSSESAIDVISGYKNRAYKVHKFWTRYLLTDDPCGFIVAGNTEFVDCPVCNCRLASQKLTRPYGKIQDRSIPIDQRYYYNNDFRKNHDSHNPKVEGCGNYLLDYDTMLEKGCISETPKKNY